MCIRARGKDGANYRVCAYIPLINLVEIFDLYKFVANSSQISSSRLIPKSNQLKIVTYGLHTISPL